MNHINSHHPHSAPTADAIQAPLSGDQQRWVEAFQEINAWLQATGVKYWINMGTLLGAVREGGLMTRTSDIDFGASIVEAPQLLRNLSVLGQRGWRVDVTTFSIFLSRPATDVVVELILYVPHGDWLWTPLLKIPPRFNGLLKYSDLLAERAIYRDYHQNIPRHYTMAYALIPRFLDRPVRSFLFKLNDAFGQRHHAMVIPAASVASLMPIRLCGMECSAPAPASDYLELIYGPDWTIPNPNWSVAEVKSLDNTLFRTRDQARYCLI